MVGGRLDWRCDVCIEPERPAGVVEIEYDEAGRGNEGSRRERGTASWRETPDVEDAVGVLTSFFGMMRAQKAGSNTSKATKTEQECNGLAVVRREERRVFVVSLPYSKNTYRRGRSHVTNSEILAWISTYPRLFTYPRPASYCGGANAGTRQEQLLRSCRVLTLCL
jgi:hypothetical protein